jgi:TPR repeat protein
MKIKLHVVAMAVGLFSNGCVESHVERHNSEPIFLENLKIEGKNQASDIALNYYNDCLKKHRDDPAKAAYKCSSLYGVAAYYRQDYNLAYKTLAPLAEQSEPMAQHYLGIMHANGHGIPVDLTLAAQWQKRAAEHGYAPAMGSLSFYYETGMGVSKDYTEAMRWRERAAHYGGSMEYFSLGNAYKEGKITPRNPVLAYMWLSLAVATSEASLRPYLELSLNKLASEMTASEILEGQRLAAQWEPGDR